VARRLAIFVQRPEESAEIEERDAGLDGGVNGVRSELSDGLSREDVPDL